MPDRVAVVPGSTRKICQLTGEIDRQLGSDRPTPNRTETRFGLRGTDLGASFEHKGRCWFLFGDTHPSGPNTDLRPFDGDTMAYTTDRKPGPDLRLHFQTAPADGRYRVIRIAAPGISTKGFEVPTGGFSANGRMYLFYTTDARFPPGGVVMGRSVLLRSDDDGENFRVVSTISRDKIIYIAPVVVENKDWKGLPETNGRGVLLWAASTQYRRSNPFLAYLPLDRIDDPNPPLRFWAGSRGWSERESDATPLFEQPQVGELCVTWNRFLRRWLMLYNAGSPRGINFRTAETPWGPWSDAGVLFEPTADRGYGHFMHIGGRAGSLRDSVHDPGREADWGGEYGAYVIDRFTQGKDRRETTIFYVLSTWNPYNTVLMTSTLKAEPR